MRVSKSALTALLVVAAVAAVVVFDFIQRSNLPVHRAAVSRRQGDPRAALKIIEYADFQCPNCAKGWALLKKYISENPDEVYLQMKYYPLNEPYSFSSALYAECAAQQGKFWPFADLLFETQSRWRLLPDAQREWRKLATQVGLDLKELDECVQGPAARAVVAADQQEGATHRIQSTPTYFINGDIIVGPESLQKRLSPL